MAYYRVQIGFPMDSALPKDVVTINPHYQGDNPQALGDALKTNLLANAQVAAATPFTVKVYDAMKAPPSYPLYTTSNGTGFRTTGKPREVALCLSYFSSFNRPRFRGRLYIPADMVPGGLALRPTDAQLDAVLLWKETFGANLPSGHLWTVFSSVEKTGRTVTDVWCDDEWDTVRSRGLRATKRTTAKVP